MKVEKHNENDSFITFILDQIDDPLQKFLLENILDNEIDHDDVLKSVIEEERKYKND